LGVKRLRIAKTYCKVSGREPNRYDHQQTYQNRSEEEKSLKLFMTTIGTFATVGFGTPKRR
jgi:hypothetical protein